MTQITPESLYDYCATNHVLISRCENGFIELAKNFTPNDQEAYAQAESDVSIIYSIPQTSQGSTWGTTGDGVGGYSALIHGRMEINRTGCSKLFVKKLAKIMMMKATGLA